MKQMDSETVKCQMMIRKPVKKVFEAFIDPEITTNLWFTKSSGKLEKGKTVKWECEMYGHSTEVFVKDIVEDEKIAIEWDKPSTNVDFVFEVLSANQTYVTIKHYGFNNSGEKLLDYIKENTGGFTTVLDGMKAFLEHNINLNLIADKYPQKTK